MRIGRLRTRLALTLLVSMVPFGLLVGWAERELRERTVIATIAREIQVRMESGGLEICEAFPAGFGERPHRGARRRRRRARRAGPPVPFYAYDPATFESANPAAPPIPQELRAQLEAGSDTASRIVEHRGEPHLQVARRLPWEGPCGVVVAHRPSRLPGGPLPMVTPMLLSIFAVLIGALAAGPMVRRIRKLTQQVKQARDGKGSIDIEGDDEISELARAFSEARDALEQKMHALEQRDEALKEYIANTTHDVMLPLTVLQGHLVALRQRLDDHAERPTLDLALEESHYLGSLLHNLNAAARLEAVDQTTFAPVDLADIVERVIARNAPIARQRNISLDHAVPAEPVRVRGDQTLLERALGNLVHNAIRHHHDNGHVAVILEEVKGTRFHLQVIDDGPGVPEAQLPKLGTQRGHQSSARTRNPSGMGIGLAITRDIATRHGFELEFENAKTPQSGLHVTLRGVVG